MAASHTPADTPRSVSETLTTMRDLAREIRRQLESAEKADFWLTVRPPLRAAAVYADQLHVLADLVVDNPPPAPAAKPWPTLVCQNGPCPFVLSHEEVEATFRALLIQEGSEGIMRRILQIRDAEPRS